MGYGHFPFSVWFCLRLPCPFPDPVAFAVDDDFGAVVQQPVEDGRGGHGVAVEDGCPLLRRDVGGDDGRAFLVALRAHLKSSWEPRSSSGR